LKLKKGFNSLMHILLITYLYCRFDSLKNSDNLSNKSSPRNFSTPKSNQYQNRIQSISSMNDWDAPDNTANQINGSWKGNLNIPINIATEDWDTAAESMPQNHKPMQNSSDISIFNPSNSKSNLSTNNVIDEEEDWDAPTGMSIRNDKASLNEIQSMSVLESNISTNNTNKEKFWDQINEASSKKKSISEIEMYNSEHRNSNSNMDENWDADPSSQSTSNTSRTAFAKDIPLYNPNNSNGQSYSNNPFNQRYENNYHSNKHPHSRNFESNDRFNRDSYSRHSRGNRCLLNFLII
jgi:hypothetical protein